ncbi:MAG: YcjF family protein [Desulfamplus sp.]|nr:YcjF family protein [Desulfamplus sp.]
MNEKLEQSRKIVKDYMWWAMGAGLLPIPIVDIATVTGVQLKMLSKLAKNYDIPFAKERGKSIITSLVSTLSASTISKGMISSAIKVVPIVGPLTVPFIMPVVAAAVTYSIGIVFIQHFESGGTFLDFNPEKTSDFFKSQFEERLNESGKEGIF